MNNPPNYNNIITRLIINMTTLDKEKLNIEMVDGDYKVTIEIEKREEIKWNKMDQI